MHKTSRRIETAGIYQTCGGCPTVFEFDDIDDDAHCYFRLRWGGWSLVDETNDNSITSGSAPQGIDGICSIEEMISMLAEAGLQVLNLTQKLTKCLQRLMQQQTSASK